MLAAAPLAAQADVIDDPTHGFCNTVTCSDNGKITTGPSFDGSHFGFSISPPDQTGDEFLLIVATPTNETATLTSVTGTINKVNIGAGHNFTTLSGTWTSGNIQDVASLSCKTCLFGGDNTYTPPDQIGDRLTSTKTVDPGATGYNLAYVELDGPFKIAGPSNSDANHMDLSIGGLPVGSLILGFLGTDETKQVKVGKHTTETVDYISWIDPSGSGILMTQTTTSPRCDNCCTGPNCDPPSVPEPGTVALLGVGLLGLSLVRRRSD